MYELEIQAGDDTPRRVALETGRWLLGKGDRNDIRIDDKLLSRSHCAIEVSADGVMIEDLGSTNGTSLAGERVSASIALPPGEAVRLGTNVTVRLIPMSAGVEGNAADVASPEPAAAVASGAQATEKRHARDAQDAEMQALKQEIQRRILEFLDLRRRGALDQMSADEIRHEARAAAEQLIDKGEIRLPEAIDRDTLLTAVVAEAIGLGPIEPLLDDDSISEIMVNGCDQIYIERSGRVELTDLRFSGPDALMNVIDRIVTPVGRRIDEGNPMIDARLPDGSRVNAVVPPLTLTGHTLTIRKFLRDRLRGADLVRFGSLNQAMADFLEICVRFRMNIVVSGGTGSGKTTTLNVLSDFIPETERIVTIEDSAELQLSQEHIVSLESRPANVEGTGEVSIRDLVRNSLRMRPDRIVVGECRGGEALDMLQAMNTGHDGSLTTGHANSPRDMLSRLEVMVMMAGMELPSRAIREQIASAVDILVQITRLSDGRRLITDIYEVGTLEGDVISLQQIFTYRRTGLDQNGNVVGYHTGLGYAPAFYQQLRETGVQMDWDIFRAVDENGEVIPE